MYIYIQIFNFCIYQSTRVCKFFFFLKKSQRSFQGSQE